MPRLIALSTAWGSRYGGINSFNADFLAGFVEARPELDVVCVVPCASDSEIKDAIVFNVNLVSMDLSRPVLLTRLTPCALSLVSKRRVSAIRRRIPYG